MRQPKTSVTRARSPRHASSAPAAAKLAVFASTAVLACFAGDSASTSGTALVQVVFSESPPRWFDAYLTSLDLAPAGSSVLFDYNRLVDAATGAASPLGVIDDPFIGTFDDAGRLVVGGRQGDDRGWFRASESGGPPIRLASIPLSAFPVWSFSGEWIAYASRSGRDSTVRIGTAVAGGEMTRYELPGPVKKVTWVPGDTTLLVMLSEEQGLSSLRALDRATGQTRIIADGLDGSAYTSNVAVSDDARVAYVALASPGVPDPEERHAPEADRDLDIYRIDLASGELQPVVQTPAEELAPVFAKGSLYWVSLETQMEAVIVPAAGGQARFVAENVQGPTWRRPDGRAIGVTTGGWRLADFGLNLDGGIIEIDAAGRATGPVTPIISGYHEDFSPVWSPDGSWIAYHSHRSAIPVTAFEGQDNADDIFLRRPNAPMSEEIRLTDFGWDVGTPDWAPDGRRLLMDSSNRTADSSDEPTSVFIIEIDPETGASLGRTRVPLPPSARGAATMDAWSPVRDEIAIVFAGPGRGADDKEIWVLAPDGTAARRVIAFQGHRYGGVDWSADGEKIIYAAFVGDRQQLFSVARSGGEPRQLTDEAASLFHPRVSPDGRWVAASRMRTVRQILRRQVTPPDRGP